MRLIDADELKMILSKEITRKFVRWDKTITVAEWETFIRDIIDNAPTINELPEKYIIQVKTREDAQKIKNVWDKNNFGNVIITSNDMEIIPLRPQGEWKPTNVSFGSCFLQGYECKCGRVVMQKEHFCPECGTDMRGKEELLKEMKEKLK